MKIQQLFDAIQIDPTQKLEEALRAGVSFNELVEDRLDEFSIGIEYEFHITPDEEYKEVEAQEELERAKDAVRNDMMDFVEALTDISKLSFKVDSKPLSDLIQFDENEELADSRSNDLFLSVIKQLASYTDEGDESFMFYVIKTLIRGRVDDIFYEDIRIDLLAIRNFATSRSATVFLNSNQELSDAYEYYLKDRELIEYMLNAVSESVISFSPPIPDVTNEILERIFDVINYDNIELDQIIEDRSLHSLIGDVFRDESHLIDSVIEDIDEMELGDYILNVVSDSSVAHGVEVITKPLDFVDTGRVMGRMFEYIDTVGYTSNSTGMHVNISHASFRGYAKIDPLRFMVLADIDYFQNLSGPEGVGSGIQKWAVRNHMVEPTFGNINDRMLQRLARSYKSGGLPALEDDIHSFILGNSRVKYKEVNWTSLFHNFDPDEARIEFRFFGGPDYTKRRREILKDIWYLIGVIGSILYDSAPPEEYYRGLIRMLNRAAARAGIEGRTTFSDYLRMV